MPRYSGRTLLVVCLTVFAAAVVWSAPVNPPLPQASGAKPHDAQLPAGAVARLGRPRLRHGHSVISVAFSPDGKLLASVGNDHLVRLWDPATGAELRQLRGHQGGVQSVAFAADGKMLLTGSHDQTLRLWEVATGKELRRFSGHDDVVLVVALSPDGLLAASEAQDATVRLWDVNTGKTVRQLPGHLSQGTSNVAFSPDGKTLATVGEDNALRLWEVATGRELRKLAGHKDDTNSLDFSPDGKLLASCSSDKTVRLWDVAEGKELKQLTGHDGLGACVRFAPDGKTVVSGSGDRTVRIWDVATGKELRRMIGHGDVVSELSISPDGRVIATAGHDGTVRLWDHGTGKEMPQSGGLFSCVALSADGKQLAGGCEDQVIRFWDAATGRPTSTEFQADSPITTLTFSADGKLLASAGEDLRITLWDLDTGKSVRQWKAHAQRIHALAFAGPVLASAGGEGSVKLWRLQTGQEQQDLAARPVARPPSSAPLLTATADGRSLAHAGIDGAIKVLDPASGRELRQFQMENGITAAAFSHDGRMLAAGTGQTMTLWEVATGKVRLLLQAPEGIGKTVAFSLDGRFLVAGYDNRVVRVWDLASGKEVRQLPGHVAPVSLAAVAGRTLATFSEDTVAILWDWERLCQGMPPNLAQLEPADLESAWTDLGSDDARRAYQAVWRLASAPEQAVTLLRERIRPARGEDGKRIARLIQDLDADEFAVRENASTELDKLGPSAEPALRDAMQGSPAPEVRRRIEQLLEKIKAGPSSPDALRVPRGVEVLERVGTEAARQALEGLTRGTPDAVLTREVKAALGRLQRSR